MELSVLKDVLTILVLFIVAIVTLFIYFKFAPVIKINIDAQRISDEVSLISIQIENTSKVRVSIKKELGKTSNANILLQCFEHEKNKLTHLTEFLPFTQDWFNAKKYPSTWKKPEVVFETTEWIYPAEVITIERPIQHINGKILHIGVQVHAKFGFLEMASFRRLSQRWTFIKYIS